MFSVVPRRAAVVGDVEAAVGADDDVPPVLRVDPQRVVVRVNAGRWRADELASAVGAPPERRVAEDVDDVVVGRVHPQSGEVERPRVQAVHAGPGVAVVAAHVDAAGLVAVLALAVLHVHLLPAHDATHQERAAELRAGRPRRTGRAADVGRVRAAAPPRIAFLFPSLNVTFTLSPALRGFSTLKPTRSSARNSRQVFTSLPSTATTLMPDFTPAFSAALPFGTSSIFGGSSSPTTEKTMPPGESDSLRPGRGRVGLPRDELHADRLAGFSFSFSARCAPVSFTVSPGFFVAM